MTPTVNVILYLIAIVAANWSVAHFGPASAIINAFLFIGLDLTTRDKLHDEWRGHHLWLRMLALVLAGSVISFLFGHGRIAAASFVAFATAGLIDTVVYQLLGERSKLLRINGSNVFAAATDSIVFPAIAFGLDLPGIWLIILGQFAAKVLGGFAWSLILNQRRRRE